MYGDLPLCVYIYISIMCMPGALGGQKRVSGPLKLELHTAVSYHVGSETWTWVFQKNTQCSSPQSHALGLHHLIFNFKKSFLLFYKKKQRTWLESYWFGGQEKMMVLTVWFMLLQQILPQKATQKRKGERVYLAFITINHKIKLRQELKNSSGARGRNG